MKDILKAFYLEQSIKNPYNINLFYEENENSLKIWKEITDNIFEKEFNETRYSFYRMLIIPSIINFISFRSKNTIYIKGLISFSSFLICYSQVNSNLNNSIQEFSKIEKGKNLKNLIIQSAKFNSSNPILE